MAPIGKYTVIAVRMTREDETRHRYTCLFCPSCQIAPATLVVVDQRGYLKIVNTGKKSRLIVVVFAKVVKCQMISMKKVALLN